MNVMRLMEAIFESARQKKAIAYPLHEKI